MYLKRTDLKIKNLSINCVRIFYHEKIIFIIIGIYIYQYLFYILST